MKRTILALLLALTGCDYGPGPVGDYSVSGTVRGVTGEGVLISDASGASVFVISDGGFVIEDAFVDGATYEIRIERDPASPPMRCAIENGAGVIRAANVEGVSIVCTAPTFTVNGTVTGLSTWGLVLESNGEEIALAKDGRFTFFGTVSSGTTYQVRVAHEPDGQQCRVANGSGTVSAEDVTNVTVVCEAASPTRLD